MILHCKKIFNTLGGLLFCILISISMPSYAKEWQKSIQLEWQETDGATGYEIEVFQKDSKKERFKNIKKERITDTSWATKLPPGRYKYRMRTFDNRNVAGPWGEDSFFEIPFLKLAPIYPKDSEVLFFKKARKNVVNISYDPHPESSGYIIEIREKGTEKFRRYTTKKSSFKVPVKIGSTYEYRVFFKGEFKDKTDKIPLILFSVKLKPLKEPTISLSTTRFLKWEKIKGAQYYSVALFEKKSKKSKWRLKYRKKVFKKNLFKLSSRLDRASDYRFEITARSPFYAASKKHVHRFDFRKMAAKDGNPRQHYSSELTYGYIPMLQRYHVTQNDVESVLEILMTNSNFLSATHFFGGKKRSFGLLLYYHRAQKSLFEEKQSDDTSNQPIIPLATNTFALKTILPIYKGFFSIALESGVQQKNFYTFENNKTTNVVLAVENITKEFMFGGHLYTKFGPLFWDGAAVYGHHFGTTPSKIESSTHFALYGDLSHAFLFDNFVVSYRYTFDYVSNVFIDAKTEATGQEAIIKSYQLGITASYLF